MEPNTQPDYLQEFEQELNLEPASTGVRFANYLTDRFAIVILLALGSVVFDILMVWTGVSYGELTTGDTGIDSLLDILIMLLLVVAYYTVLEAAFKGRTIGKWLTGTMAVQTNGAVLSFKKALLRTLCRFIPFEAFSALGGKPWHDTITDTVVVNKRR